MTKTTMLTFAFACTAMLATGACKRADPQAAAQAAAAQAAARETAAMEQQKVFDAAVAHQDWALAKAQGDVLIARYPGTRAADTVQAQMADLRPKAEAAREHERLAALWTYQRVAAGKGEQVTASIDSKNRIDSDGRGEHAVQLIFRDHPGWGRSAYLVLQGGDFDCYGGCRLKVEVDGKARTLPGSRPKTDQAIAMFIDDEKSLWRMLDGAKSLTIGVPFKGVGKRDVTFEVGGLDRARMPGWG